ncbi:diguanylate cyclase domain-containing protein [Aminobacter aganoensis]|uniref:Diguanylate cyclase (GGDEF)-like protein n=1 Tax=Aminobacter aganoensis TaxID=83264 RepID=A0A7X0F948_9HYPH|nr:diguanylate cyclase [Aminobacter aganoensis]MBB6355382.1 diguanylate cyclase (GGDEF)-like protein [Aminobacter aganoensis]
MRHGLSKRKVGRQPQRGAARIARLEAQLAAQAALIEQQAASLAHSQKIFDRSSAAARIGVWQCNLADQALDWTDVVYDIFDLPRGSVLERREIVKCYAPESAAELHVRRSKAIEDRTGFGLDAEIVTVKGNRRWIRITACVESENGVAVRIFGLKQDITEEKILADRMRYLAEFDVMTGLANRGRFQSTLQELTASDAGKPAVGALLLVDLDGFKQINDTFGHMVGDECLKQVARRLEAACCGAQLVSRIGGDEFAVLTGPQHGLSAVSELARAIIERLGEPIDHCGALLRLGASVGIALFEAGTPSELLVRADTALYQAKAAGRNTFRIFKPSDTAGMPGHRAA